MPKSSPFRILLFILLICLSFIYISKKHPSKVIKIKSGKEFTLTMESNRTTGFEWQLAAPLDEKIIRLVGSEYMPTKPQLIGSGGEELWTFKAIGPGKANILFKYARPWEKDAPPAQKEAFSISVLP